MQWKLRKLVGGTMILAAVVTTLAVPASAAPAHGPSVIASADDDDQARRCRWVSRVGLVCDTKLSTVNP